MHKLLVVIRREFIERVRTKWFIIGTVLGPVFMAAVIVLPMLMAEKGAKERNIVVLDATTDGFGARLATALGQTGSVKATREPVPLGDLEERAGELAKDVGGRAPLDGIFLVTDEATADGRAEYRGSNVTSMTDMPLPCQSSSSACACSNTSSGSTAGPALKL